jgi:hypothetical protein
MMDIELSEIPSNHECQNDGLGSSPWNQMNAAAQHVFHVGLT